MSADAFTATVPRSRFDWQAARRLVGMPQLAEALLGPPDRKEAGRLLWRCPLHAENTPSFMVDADRPTWRCWGCGEHGDGADLVAKLEGLDFPSAARRAAEIAGVYLPESGEYRPPKPRPAAPPPPPEASGLPEPAALRLVEDAEARLWSADGAEGLAYLRGPRGLDDATIRDARLGWTAGEALPKKGDGVWRTGPGVVIPWFDAGRLALVKIRRTDVSWGPKYAEAFRDLPIAFPSLSVVRPGRPLVVVEGEFDALLLGQQIGDLAAVFTLGSASSKPSTELLAKLLSASPWFLALDGDEAGDKAAAGWPARARRVRPFAGAKDWSDLHATGRSRIRYHWLRRLGFKAEWEELEPQRWGPALLPDPMLDAIGPRGIEPAWLDEFNRLLGRANPDGEEVAADGTVQAA